MAASISGHIWAWRRRYSASASERSRMICPKRFTTHLPSFHSLSSSPVSPDLRVGNYSRALESRLCTRTTRTGAVIHRMVERPDGASTLTTGRPFHRDRAVRIVPVDARLLPRPEKGFPVAGVYRERG